MIFHVVLFQTISSHVECLDKEQSKLQKSYQRSYLVNLRALCDVLKKYSSHVRPEIEL